MIALAVRAFRAADAADAPAESVSAGTAATVQVSVGGRPGPAQGLPARSADVLAEALALADQVLIEGSPTPVRCSPPTWSGRRPP
ncbi:hypothetical protein ACFQZC_24825 [Streptacidiphilus monticola]